MNNLDELRQIWRNTDTSSLPASADIILLVGKYRNKTLRKKFFLIVVAIILASLMFGAMARYDSAMLSTRIGEWLLIIAAAMLAWTNARSLPRFYRLENNTNRDFLLFLEKTRQNQHYFFRRTQVIALACCSAGLLLYMFELVHKNTNLTIIVYAALVVYLLLIWTVLRPRMFRKQSAKLNGLITKTESLLNQLK